jgi:hypothetical protein
LLEAYDFAGDFAVAVDDVGFWDHGGAVGLGDGGDIVFGGWVAVGEVGDRLGVEELFEWGVRFVGGYA